MSECPISLDRRAAGDYAPENGRTSFPLAFRSLADRAAADRENAVRLHAVDIVPAQPALAGFPRSGFGPLLTAGFRGLIISPEPHSRGFSQVRLVPSFPALVPRVAQLLQ
jgi:hypothetical protein